MFHRRAHVQEEPTLADLASQQGTVPGARGKKRARHMDSVESAGARPGSRRATEANVLGEAVARTGEQQREQSRHTSKHRPTEQTSKRPVKRLREVVEGTGRPLRDPRFDHLAGEYVEDKFRKQYSFLYDEHLPQEQQDLRASIKKSRSREQKKELHQELIQVQQQLGEEQRRRKSHQISAEQKAKEREAVRSGKRPYFLKASDRKQKALIERYHQLKESGNLEKAMAKRRKKLAAKDHRLVPRGRRVGK